MVVVMTAIALIPSIIERSTTHHYKVTVYDRDSVWATDTVEAEDTLYYGGFEKYTIEKID